MSLDIIDKTFASLSAVTSSLESFRQSERYNLPSSPLTDQQTAVRRYAVLYEDDKLSMPYVWQKSTAKTSRKQNPTLKGYLSLSCIPHCKAKHLLRSCFPSMLGKSMEPT